MNRLLYNFKMQYNGKTFEINNFNKNKSFFTFEYNVENNAANKIQESTFVIYNLPENITNHFAKAEEEEKDIDVVCSIGNSADNNVAQIFAGKARQILTTGFITLETTITAYPIADTKIYSQINLKKDSTINDLKTILATKLKLTLDNQAGDGDVKLQKDYNNITQDVLSLAKNKFSNQDVFIDNGKLIFTLKKDKTITPTTNPYVFTESNGLIEGPTPSGLLKEVKTYVRPNIKLNDNVVVAKKRIIDKNYNGSYIVCGYKHSGKISDTSSVLNYSVFQLMAPL